MRFLIPLAAILVSLPATAQNDDQPRAKEGSSQVNSIIGTIGQIKVEDDNDPFTPNSFVGSFRMEMHHFKNGKENKDSPTNMHFWSSPEKTLISVALDGVKPGGGGLKVLTDHKGKWRYFLMADAKGNKTAMKSRMKKYTFPSMDDGEQAKFTVTDETKMIDGHLCTKVTGTTEDGSWTGWVAKDIKVSFSDIAGNMSRNAMQGPKQDWSGVKGFPLEFETVSKDSKERTVAYVKDLQVGEVDPGVFSLSGYTVMEVPGIHRNPGK